MHTIEFTDIRIRAALPLHPYLAKHPCLFLKLAADGDVCEETPWINGDLATGVWEFNSKLYAHAVKQSLTITVVPGVKDPGIQGVSVTLKVAELLERVTARPNGYQDFDIFDSSVPIQLKLAMTCSITFPSIVRRSSQDVDDGVHTVNEPKKNTQSYFGPEKLEFPSREDLETSYAEVIRMPDWDDDKARRLCHLGRTFHALYYTERGIADLRRGVSIHEEAMQRTGLLHPQLAEHTHCFAIALLDRFREGGDPADIERAISLSKTAVKRTHDLDVDKPARLSNLGKALRLRFERMGDLADMESSISCLQKAVYLTPDCHPDKSSWLSNLGTALGSRFDRLGNLADIDAAISSLQQAVELTPGGHPDEPSRFDSLGVALQLRFERVGSLEDLGDAVSNHRKAVELAPDGHISTPSMLCNLGTALQSRFKRFGDTRDLNNAIFNLRKAVDLTSDGHHDRSRLFNNLGDALQLRFEHLDTLTDLDEAILIHQQAVELTSDDDPDRPSWLGNLGNALNFRFKRLDNLVDLDDAISNHRKAVELTPDADSKKPMLFNNLSIAVKSRFSRLGSLEDLDDAISNNRKAINLTPDGDPNKGSLFCNLGGALKLRFLLLGSLKDVDNAISVAQKAVALMPDGHPDEPDRLNTLGSALISRFQHLGNLKDLGGAILSHRKAVELTPDDHPSQPNRLGELGSAIRVRFDYLGTDDDLAEIDEAILTLQQVIEITPDCHPNEPMHFNNLGLALRSRFERFGSSTDVDDAISNHRKAVELTPEGHPNKTGFNYNLGLMLVPRFQRLSILSDLEDGLSTLSDAANSTRGSATMRFNAAHLWAKTAEKHSRSPVDAFRCAINLLPQIAWLGLSIRDQHVHLAEFGGIVRDAVAAAIRYEEYETAVVWTEQGRSIVWQNLLGLRSPVDNLRIAHPALADQVQSISKQLEGSGSRDAPEVPMVSLEGVSSTYSKLAVKRDDIVDEIRKIPEFKDFLRAKSFSQLTPAAHEGPVVILNLDDSQCNALILVADSSDERHVSAVNIPLERFSHEKSKKLFQGLTSLLSSAGVRDRNDHKSGRAQSRADSEAKFKKILRILWQDVVKPVIEGLAFQPQAEKPPRVWWCATGLLAFLPIHAAGLYDTQEVGDKVSDYWCKMTSRFLMVAQPSTPGAPPIPKTEEEVQIIDGLTTDVRRLKLMRENATVERVREGMMESNWIHLACHGQQNPADPMESGFLLHDKILKLSEIVKMSLPKADFAFPSACQTAMGDENVAEESAHLAAGMLLSGCRGVIVTTWSIRDKDAPKIAEDVYSRIFKDGKPNRKGAAYALHEAVKRLRESGAECTSWVPFIHIGR